MGYDNKYGRVTTEFGTIGENEPVIVFRAQDKLLPRVLEFYLHICREEGSPENHLRLINYTRKIVCEWQEKNYTQIPRSNASQ